MTEDSTRTHTTAGELRIGQHVVLRLGGAVVETTVCTVENVHPYTDFHNGDEMVSLLFTKVAGGNPFSKDWRTSSEVRLATAEEMAAVKAEMAIAKEDRRRELVAAALVKLAKDIVELKLPVTSSWFNAEPGVLASRADLDRWAEYVGCDVQTSNDIPSIRGRIPLAERLELHIDTQSRKEPKPAAEDADATPAYGDEHRPGCDPTCTATHHGGLCGDPWHEQPTEPTEPCPACGDQPPSTTVDAVEPEHYHAAGAIGGAGENSAVCACGAAVGGFDSQAEALAVLNEHIANPDPAAESVDRGVVDPDPTSVTLTAPQAATR